MRLRSILPAALAALLATGSAAPGEKTQPAPAGDTPGKAGHTEKAEKPEKPEKPEEPEEPSVSHGRLKAGGLTYPYRAEAGRIALKADDGKAQAQVFYVAYTIEGEEAAAAERPVAFCFNGGGSSAVWLHLGGLGPKRIPIPKKGTGFPTPPFSLKQNPDSALPAADLVFIDPVSTGFSRAADSTKAGELFHGFQQDIESVGEFIRLWTTKNGRWGSPKFLVGESYGAIRASALASHLQARFGMYLNGVVLVSGVLDFGTLSATEGNDRPYSIYLPRMTAVAHYHGKLEGDLDKLLARSRAFASGPLPRAHRLGDQLPAPERAALAKELAALTAIPPETVRRADLRISPSLFRKHLLRDEGKIIGRFDGRVVAAARDELGAHPRGDPSYDNVFGAFATAMNTYLREELGYQSEDTYEVLGGRLRGWDFGQFENRFAAVGGQLASAMQANPHLKVLVNCGNHDLATPGEAIAQSIAQLELPPALRKNITFTHYDGGHMLYTHPASRKTWGADLREFFGTPDPTTPAAETPAAEKKKVGKRPRREPRINRIRNLTPAAPAG